MNFMGADVARASSEKEEGDFAFQRRKCVAAGNDINARYRSQLYRRSKSGNPAKRRKNDEPKR